MSNNTIIQQGFFTSTGADVFIPLRSGVSWMKVYNYTIYGAQTADNGVNYYWQLGMNNGDAIIELFNGAGTAITGDTAAILGVPGFTFVDTSVATVSAPVAFTMVSNATPPVVSTADTSGLIAGQSIVRMYFQNGTGPFAQQLAGIDFTVGTVINNTSFTLQNMSGIAATSGAVGGTFSILHNVRYWYPSNRIIASITQANNAVVTTTVNHNYQVGQQVRFSNVNQVRPGSVAYGMTQINGLTGNIIATTATTFTVDINTTGFNAFAFPVTANVPFTPAEVIPVGEDTATALAQPAPGVNLLSDATTNTAQIGMLLGGAATVGGITAGPAGSNGDVMFWTAGNSFNV
jgi:hypothetical protein